MHTHKIREHEFTCEFSRNESTERARTSKNEPQRPIDVPGPAIAEHSRCIRLEPSSGEVDKPQSRRD